MSVEEKLDLLLRKQEEQIRYQQVYSKTAQQWMETVRDECTLQGESLAEAKIDIARLEERVISLQQHVNMMDAALHKRIDTTDKRTAGLGATAGLIATGIITGVKALFDHK